MYTQLEYQDRVTIEIQLNRWAKYKEIWRILWKHPSSISREVSRNSVKKRGNKKQEYLAIEAEIKHYQRCWRSHTKSMKINMNSELKLFIIEQIQRKDIIPSPKVIASLWKEKQEKKWKWITISHTSIYSWLETWDGNKYKYFLAHRFKGYNTGRKKWDIWMKGKIKNRVGIEERPEIINERWEVGHFEADLIVSSKWKKGKETHKSALLTLTDRKSRLPRIYKLKNKESRPIMNIIQSLKEELWIRSVTFDNGMEFAKHYLLEWIQTYFCNPYSSWEKWSIENLNKIIRRFFPKGTNFDEVPEEKIRSICNIIANTPREILEFKSPNQVHFSL